MEEEYKQRAREESEEMRAEVRTLKRKLEQEELRDHNHSIDAYKKEKQEKYDIRVKDQKELSMFAGHKLKELNQKYKVQIKEILKDTDKQRDLLEEHKRQEKEKLLKEKKDYAKRVLSEHKPVVSERLRNELKTLQEKPSATAQWGRQLGHADPIILLKQPAECATSLKYIKNRKLPESPSTG